jgi:hypothetical protein
MFRLCKWATVNGQQTKAPLGWGLFDDMLGHNMPLCRVTSDDRR